jgi:hypothetical protein
MRTCETCIHDGIEKEGRREVHVCLNPRLDDPGMNDLMVWIGTQEWAVDGLAPDAVTECPDFEPKEIT